MRPTRVYMTCSALSLYRTAAPFLLSTPTGIWGSSWRLLPLILTPVPRSASLPSRPSVHFLPLTLSVLPSFLPCCNLEVDNQGPRLVRERYEGCSFRVSFCQGLGSGDENRLFGIVKYLRRAVHVPRLTLQDLQSFKDPLGRFFAKHPAG